MSLIYKKLFFSAVLATTVLFSSTGEELTKVNGCMACHNIMGTKEAPAFMGTARKNIKWYGVDAQKMMIQSIKNGSKAKYRNFSNTQMPAYGHLSDSDLDIITTWILSEYEKNRGLNRTQRGNSQSQGTRRGQGMRGR